MGTARPSYFAWVPVVVVATVILAGCPGLMSWLAGMELHITGVSLTDGRAASQRSLYRDILPRGAEDAALEIWMMPTARGNSIHQFPSVQLALHRSGRDDGLEP